LVKCPYWDYEGVFKVFEIQKYIWWNVYFYKCFRCKGRFKWQIDSVDMYKDYIIGASIKREGQLTYKQQKTIVGGKQCRLS
jgi:hypothetical protein